MILLDTHVWAWSLHAPHRLSAAAWQALEDNEARLISAVSLYEVAQKVTLGKWPEMASYMDRATELIAEQGAQVVPVSADIALAAGRVDWSHRDPFDRLIAATALAMRLVLVSADPAFDTHPANRLRRLW